MKFLKILLLSLSVIFLPQSLFAAAEDTYEFENYLVYEANGDENYLYLDFFISNELEFADEYTTMTNEKGRGCEVTCKPIQGHKIVSATGRELEKILFTVHVKNLPNTSRVDCTVIKKCCYKATNKEGNLETGSFTYTYTAELKNPAIVYEQDPLFSLFKDNKQGGYIAFKNSFPYSQAK